jgi:hypothetical protein
MLELRLLKREKGGQNVKDRHVTGELLDKQRGKNFRAELDFAYLFVVNVVDQQSYLIIAGRD